ncbi:MAG: leucine-rich repeat domain-containing protein [Atopobiaceae bacterium]|nr:leucine-rich repeat domain-containing protein [Atopobiaceae bacterium]
MVNFYTIDAQTSAFGKKICRVAGDNITWELSGTTLSFTDEGPLDVDNTVRYRYPVSTCRKSYSNPYYVWDSAKYSAESVVIGEGITEISNRSFYYYSNLTEATIPSSVGRIGAEAFEVCENLATVTIYTRAAEIGENAFWSGWHYSKYFPTTFRLYKRSAIEQYAKDTSIPYEYINEDISGATIAVDAGEFVYDGQEKKPGITVTLDGTKLVPDDDYRIASYQNNVNAGTATVTIEGYQGFSGTASQTFTIQKASLANATIAPVSDRAYLGRQIRPKPKVTVGGRTLVEGTDYTLSYGRNLDEGHGTVMIAGTGNYQGSRPVSFVISKAITNWVMYRLYNPNSGEHFYTASEKERDSVVAAGWKYEGKAWYALEGGSPA